MDSPQKEKTSFNPGELDKLSPREIVAELDKYIISQKKAKRAVAIAIRNRVRRRKVSEEFRDEIYPKNIIMIGPTGCGKTEIARRLARLARAPFVKVEATKYTEVGYVGRDVESMIRDLMNTAVNLVQKEFRENVTEQAQKSTRKRLLDLLLPSSAKAEQNAKGKKSSSSSKNISLAGQLVREGLEIKDQKEENNTSNKQKITEEERSLRVRETLAKKLDNKELEEREVEIEISAPVNPMVQVMTGGPNLEDMDMHIQSVLGDFLPKKSKRRRVKLEEARRILMEEEQERLVDADKVREEALHRTEQMGIVFIDEIDKICGANMSSSNMDVSREGVQRDLLPIVEGATVNTRHGSVKTDHILFVAAGAFHSTSPSDLIPELQGRFPIRVELDKLGESDFRQILTGPRNSLTRQSKELLATEEVELEFTTDGIAELARFAFEVNEKTENIGARRLHTLMEHLLDETSFEASELPPDKRHVVIDKAFVNDCLKDIVADKDLSRYIL